MSKPKLPPVQVLGPFGPIMVSGCVMAALTPERLFHYGEPTVAQSSKQGSICIYLRGNGPLGERVNMVARQMKDQCIVETRSYPMDFVISTLPFTGAGHITFVPTPEI